MDKYALAHDVLRLLEGELDAIGFELLDVRVFRGGGRLQLRIYVDTAYGIDLDGCARASRTVGMLLEESDLIPGPYVIEVSSPGIRRPLRAPAHFAAQVGQRVDVRRGPVDHPRRVHGELLAADAEGITVHVAEQQAAGGSVEEPAAEPAGRDVRLGYADILEADLDPDFDPQALIREDRRRRKDEKRQRRAERRGRKGTGKKSQ